MRPIRAQRDGLGDKISLQSGIDYSGPLADTTRQELGPETDINRIVARYGLGDGAPQRATVFGEVDYTVDLQRAKHILYDVQKAWTQLPKSIKQDYRNWRALFTALENNTFKVPEQVVNPPDPQNVKPDPKQ